MEETISCRRMQQQQDDEDQHILTQLATHDALLEKKQHGHEKKKPMINEDKIT